MTHLRAVSRVMQRLPLFRGKTRLCRAVLGKRLAVADAVVESRWGQRFCVPYLGEPVAFQILINGAYEPETLAALRRLLPANGVFIDAGASIGFFSITLGAAVPGARILAVEASHRIAGYLTRNLELNGLRNVTVVERALTDCDGATIPFYDAPSEHFGMGSIGAKYWSATSSVETASLDRVAAMAGVERVDLIKMDIEGAEALALRGAARVLSAAHAPTIVFEFWDEAERAVAALRPGDSQRILRDHGYDIWRIGDWLRGAAPIADVLESGTEMLVAQKRMRREPAR